MKVKTKGSYGQSFLHLTAFNGSPTFWKLCLSHVINNKIVPQRLVIKMIMTKSTVAVAVIVVILVIVVVVVVMVVIASSLGQDTMKLSLTRIFRC